MDQQINAVINNIADKLGVAAETISSQIDAILQVGYPVLIKQIYTQALGYGVFFILSLFLVVFLYKRFKKDETGSGHFTGLFCLLSLSILVSAGLLLGCVKRIINPDWFAIELIAYKIYELLK